MIDKNADETRSRNSITINGSPQTHESMTHEENNGNIKTTDEEDDDEDKDNDTSQVTSTSDIRHRDFKNSQIDQVGGGFGESFKNFLQGASKTLGNLPYMARDGPSDGPSSSVQQPVQPQPELVPERMLIGRPPMYNQQQQQQHGLVPEQMTHTIDTNPSMSYPPIGQNVNQLENQPIGFAPTAAPPAPGNMSPNPWELLSRGTDDVYDGADGYFKKSAINPDATSQLENQPIGFAPTAAPPAPGNMSPNPWELLSRGTDDVYDGADGYFKKSAINPDATTATPMPMGKREDYEPLLSQLANNPKTSNKYQELANLLNRDSDAAWWLQYSQPDMGSPRRDMGPSFQQNSIAPASALSDKPVSMLQPINNDNNISLEMGPTLQGSPPGMVTPNMPHPSFQGSPPGMVPPNMPHTSFQGSPPGMVPPNMPHPSFQGSPPGMVPPNMPHPSFQGSPPGMVPPNMPHTSFQGSPPGMVPPNMPQPSFQGSPPGMVPPNMPQPSFQGYMDMPPPIQPRSNIMASDDSCCSCSSSSLSSSSSSSRRTKHKRHKNRRQHRTPHDVSCFQGLSGGNNQFVNPNNPNINLFNQFNPSGQNNLGQPNSVFGPSQWMHNASTYAIPSCMSMCCRMLMSGGREGFQEHQSNDRVIILLDKMSPISASSNQKQLIIDLAEELDSSVQQVLAPNLMLHAGMHCGVLVVIAVFAMIRTRSTK
jgi:hypothetical protein